MKSKIPIWQLKENISGVRIDRINDAYISSLFDDISKLHRKDHFMCLMLTAGNAELLVDFKKIHVARGKLVFLLPGQILRAVKFNNNSDGWVLFLDNKLVDEQVRLTIEDSLFRTPILSISATDLQWFTQYFELLSQTYNDDTLGSFHKSAVNTLVAPGIYKIASAFLANTEFVSRQHSQRSIEVTKKFRQLVRKHYRDLKKPRDYGAMMSLSVNYLNDTIKSVTGFTVTYFIQQEMLREGQRLLGYSDLSIKEISAYLGYEDPSYFNRIFTKLAAISPGRFRNNYKS